MPVNLTAPTIVKAGTPARVSATFTTGTPPVNTDPGAVTWKVYKPDGTSSTPSGTKDGTGLYHMDLDTTTGITAGFPAGMYLVEASGTSPVQEVLDARVWVWALGN